MLQIFNKIKNIKKKYGINHCIKYSSNPDKFKYALLCDLNKVITHFEKYYFKNHCSNGNIFNQITYKLNYLEKYLNNYIVYETNDDPNCINCFNTFLDQGPELTQASLKLACTACGCVNKPTCCKKDKNGNYTIPKHSEC
tara:strand:- start:169 stop:588 length:420 start_codon:yes stop_codon:yes gene_type:complete